MTRVSQFGERMMRLIESQQWLDIPSYKLEHGYALILSLLGDSTERVRDLLHGTWFGHPVHPPLTDVPIGAWTAALAFDAADLANLARPSRRVGHARAARMCVGLGLGGAAASALTGLTDWQYTHDNARRLGLAHGALNTVGVGLYVTSWLARRRGHGIRGRALGACGYAVVLASAHLGGTLVSRHRIGVDHSDRSLEPRQFVPVLADADLVEGAPRRVDVEGAPVLLVRSDGTVHALTEHCSHLGGPLSEGWLYRGTIVCPWHGSRFDLATGQPLASPATAPIHPLETRIREGQIEIRCRPPVPGAAPGSVVAREQGRADAGD